jgi:hypothetical protein
MELINTIGAIVGTVSFPLCVYFLKGIHDDIKENRKDIITLDKRVFMLEQTKKIS